MSKNLKRNTKDSKEGTYISVKESEEQMQTYRSKKKENVEFVLKFFLISVSILFGTNIYIHKTVIFSLIRILTIIISR